VTASASGRASIASAPASRPSTANFEIKFMTDMIDHHHMAVMMAEMCITKAVHSELRALCERIRAAQMAEIEQMQTWLQQWYGISYEPVMRPGDQNMMDRRAAQSLREHHQDAVRRDRADADMAVSVVRRVSVIGALPQEQ
jgi:uncharacterized protein (DUF305 family)